MSVPTIAGVELGGSPELPLLLCGPSLGTSVTALWSGCADLLGQSFHVVGWDLPGHGASPAPAQPFTLAELASAVAGLVVGLGANAGAEKTGGFLYAGDSVGGAVGLQLLLDYPELVRAAVLCCTGARIGEPQAWHERAELVRASGTGAVLTSSGQRWFGPGFVEREPAVSSALLHSLRDADRGGYAEVCAALAAFDVRERLPDIAARVLLVAGSDDRATPPELAEATAAGMPAAEVVVLPGVAHLAPAEAPRQIADLVLAHARSVETVGQLRADGLRVRREVLGDAHVDRAQGRTTGLTRDFQSLITEYAWGSIWTRPGLDRRSRSMITVTALVARGHHEELALHLRAARTNGLTIEEIKEVLLQSAIYCGVPDANTAFRIAQQVFEEPSESDAR